MFFLAIKVAKFVDYLLILFFSLASFVSRIVKVGGGIIAGPVRAGFVYSNTALRKEETPNSTRRGKECLQAIPKFLIASPSFHGGRGALPSAGGHPADLTFLAGGGC